MGVRLCPGESSIKEDRINDTWVIPTIQFAPVQMKHDQHVFLQLLRSVPKTAKLRIASGYLNFSDEISHALVETDSVIDVMTASPPANGFYGARGPKGAVPMVYSVIEKNFFDIVTRGREGKKAVTLHEYIRPGWTYHAKGVWGSDSPSDKPSMTIIGSSNFGRRSFIRDLESQVILFSRNKDIHQKLEKEYLALEKHTEAVDTDLWRRTTRKLKGFGWQQGHWIRPAARIVKTFL